jgi:hypothetical protein
MENIWELYFLFNKGKWKNISTYALVGISLSKDSTLPILILIGSATSSGF